ncbi:sigma 54-interacting transcriptional regulator [Salsipaludibacter albus]|uniref:sigma 54-interacting transcriptional regulator n=1 Tax=Salsipaludibacter albus TaxID=2849650 RepID=UPI002367AD0A|nr:sigma 54-interacting transcriptional regulator [Salsipaludibacter albus]MBY5164498.1 sigma 54-interacting transcriptional regulator [Salsipaludibacter albus]
MTTPPGSPSASTAGPGTAQAPPDDLPSTLRELRASGWSDRTVREELRANLIARLRAGDPLVADVVGFEHSVLPDLERSLLAGHDLILLGERGQAKTRIVRRLVELLDEWAPIVAGCELHSSPDRPLTPHARAQLAEHGDDTPIAWIHRDQRFNEKLATPDTAVADLVGDVDPIKVAEGRHLSDEGTIHWGLLPRSNRGLFAMNELPDLPERIQVSLLNVLEERDVQVRGYPVRLDLDVVLVATANPDDYTNRGRIISPLKDRFGSQVRTHYPHTIADEVAIVRQEATPGPAEVAVAVPDFMDEVVARLTHQLRANDEINQRSGVSVRFTIGGHETMVAGAVRRAVRLGESTAVPRIADLWPLVSSAQGRIEFDTLDEGREEDIVTMALRRAILETWREHLAGVDVGWLLDRFDVEDFAVVTGSLVGARDLLDQVVGDDTSRPDGLVDAMTALGVAAEDPGAAASVLELLLEGLHLGRRLSKDVDAGLGDWLGGDVDGDTVFTA